MLKHLINFYKVSSDKPCTDLSVSACQRRLKRLQWSTFLAATLGYGMYYVCRLSLNVVKKPIVEEGIFSETELGIIGSVLFFTYAIGKFTNGFLADRSNINRFMTTGLLVTALVNLCLGFVHSFILFAILWGISGWFQSMGAASCVVGLSRWFTDKQRGSFYGFWSASHNIGEAMTFIIIASIVSAFGWRYGFFGAGLVGLAGALIAWRFFHDTPQSKGLPIVNMPKAKKKMSVLESEEFSRAQKAVLRNPAIWILALSSAFMYISRYAVNSWGVFYLEAQKGYSTLDASFIISISSVCGIVGTMFSGVISDKLFGGRRNVPALIFGLMNVVALCLFLLVSRCSFLGGRFGHDTFRPWHRCADLLSRRADGCRYCSAQCFGRSIGRCRYSQLYRCRIARRNERRADRREQAVGGWRGGVRLYLHQLVLDRGGIAIYIAGFVCVECAE